MSRKIEDCSKEELIEKYHEQIIEIYQLKQKLIDIRKVLDK